MASTKNLILNGSNLIPITNQNNVYQYNFAQGQFQVEEGDTMSINSIALSSIINISASLGNNTFSYTIPTTTTTTTPDSSNSSTTVNVTLPDGYYTVDDINTALQKSFKANGFYWYSPFSQNLITTNNVSVGNITQVSYTGTLNSSSFSATQNGTTLTITNNPAVGSFLVGSSVFYGTGNYSYFGYITAITSGAGTLGAVGSTYTMSNTVGSTTVTLPSMVSCSFNVSAGTGILAGNQIIEQTKTLITKLPTTIVSIGTGTGTGGIGNYPINQYYNIGGSGISASLSVKHCLFNWTSGSYPTLGTYLYTNSSSSNPYTKIIGTYGTNAFLITWVASNIGASSFYFSTLGESELKYKYPIVISKNNATNIIDITSYTIPTPAVMSSQYTFGTAMPNYGYDLNNSVPSEIGFGFTVSDSFYGNIPWNNYPTDNTRCAYLTIPTTTSTTRTIGNLLGFQGGNYPSINTGLTTNIQTASSDSLSASIPFYPSLNNAISVIVRCNLIDNTIGMPSDILNAFSIPYGSNSIVYQPVNNLYVKMRKGKYNNLTITLTDQNGNPLQISDSNILISLIIKSLEKK